MTEYVTFPIFNYDDQGTPKFIIVRCEGKLRVFERLSIE